MQKVIQRTILAEKQAARRLAKRKDKIARDWRKSNREQRLYTRSDEVAQIRNAQRARREDYELGPLAPRRDVGSAKETYGTINGQRIRGQPMERVKIEEALKNVGGKYLNIVVGDRVVLLEGRDKGKIGKITATNLSAAECTVEGLNMVDVEVPKWMQTAEESDKRPVRTVEKPVPFSTVRLVYAMADKEGHKTDVIVKKLVNRSFFFNRHSGRTSWARIIPGLNIRVPWPKTPMKEHRDGPSDSMRLDVDARTFVPTLLRPPMPGSIIDELRNKYSKFRTRHDPEYIEAKIQEEEELKAKKRSIKEMDNPLKEVNRKARKERKAKGKGILTREMLERIGRVIAEKKQLASDATTAPIAKPVVAA